MPAKMQPFPEVLKTSSNDFLLKKIARIFNKTHRYNFGSSPFLSLLLLFSTLVGILLRIAEAASAGSNKDNLLMKMEPTTTEIPFSSASATLWPSSATSGNDGPLRKWQQQRLVRCIFCMNYDDYNNLSTFGCELKRMNTCLGNFCYMRQHKRQEYFLYTSGCINLTNSELVGLRFNIAALEAGPIRWGAETQLCEVGQSVNTCICTNRHLCNNVSAVEPYIEYSDTIFAGIDFDELAHFRFLLPDDPILHEFERERNSGGGSYLLVKDTAISSSCSTNLFLLAIPLLLPLFHQQLASIAFLSSNKFLYL